jgi:protein-disulfide isomerase-like protein with CxxC motif
MEVDDDMVSFETDAMLDGRPCITVEHLVEALDLSEDGQVLRELPQHHDADGRRVVFAADVEALFERLGLPVMRSTESEN